MINGLDLFSGIGGISLALSPWVRPLAYCENDRFAQSVLLSRMRRRELTTAPIWDDVTTLLPELLPRSEIDIVYGGFPCQDISVAGTGAGLEGERSGLFFHIIRLVSELRPRFVFLENVPAITVRGLDRVLLELTALGYDSRWTIVSAAEMGAVHLRERWFLLGHANGKYGELSKSKHSNTDGELLREEQEQIGEFKNSVKSIRACDSRASPWSSEGFTKPAVGRAGDGIPNRLDRHRGLGNAVVPAQAKEAFMRLMGIAS